jgi:hypothetical protein
MVIKMDIISQNTKQRYENGFYDSFIDIVNNRPNEIVKKHLMVGVTLLRRNLTKRQLNIVHMISMLSFLYGNSSCIIPKLQDFENTGISKTLIKHELTKLVELGIITWIKEKDKNIFSINDITLWKAPHHYGYSETRASEIYRINLKYLREQE